MYPIRSTLDTSLKRNTGFIKRCRTNLGEESLSVFLQDISTISLQKYLSEILSAICEGFTKCRTSNDFFAGVEVASALHQRFGKEFSPALQSMFLQGISNPPKSSVGLTTDAKERELSARNERHKIVLRVIIELWLVGVFRDVLDSKAEGYNIPSYALKKDNNMVYLNPPLAALQEVLEYDLVDYTSASLAAFIVKQYGSILFGSDDQLVRTSSKQQFKEFFTSYTLGLQNKLKSLAEQCREMEKANNAAFIRTGKVLENRANDLTTLQTKIEELRVICQSLSDQLGLEMPTLKVTFKEDEKVLISLSGAAMRAEELGIWDDEEQRRFYEDIPDYSAMAELTDEDKSEEEKPLDNEGNDEAILKELDAMMDTEPESNDKTTSAESPKEESNEAEMDDEDFNLSPFTEEEPQEKGLSATGQKIVDLWAALSTQQTREHVDTIAAEFILFNNKATRKKLIRNLTNLDINEQYQLPFYCRFIAILDPVCKEISNAVIEYIVSYFRWLHKRRKSPKLYARRLFNLRYIAELTKFGLVPIHVIFYEMKTMIASLDAANIENIFILFEGCGRYLMRKPESNALMVKMVRVLEFRKTQRYFSMEEKSMIDGAIAFINPPPKVEVTKQRPVIEQYIRWLIYHELAAGTTDTILVQLKKMQWNDMDTFRALRKVFFKIWKINYGNVTHMAYLLYNLSFHYRGFSVYVVDAVLEEIRRGLEDGSFQQNQKRVALMKYLCELYRYKLVDSDVMYETFYLVLTFGYPGGRPRPGVRCPLDTPNDYFRIKLICTVFESNTVIQMLDSHGSMKLDLFLLFFQYYVFLKDPLPMETQFQFNNSIRAARPNWKPAANGREATIQLQRMIDISEGRTPPPELSETDASEEKQSPEIQETEEERIEREKAESQRREEEARIRKRKEDERAAQEFEREFQRLMLSRVGKNTERQVEVFDAPVPVVQQEPSPASSGTRVGKGRVFYSLMTKKNTKPKNLSIPEDSQFVVSVSEEQQREYEKRAKIKDFVLNYDYDTAETTRLRKIIQPELKSTRYSRLKFRLVAPQPSSGSSSGGGGGESSLDAFLNEQ